MRVLHVNTYDQGGAANACIRLHKGLRKNGIDSKVLTLYQNGSKQPNIHPMYSSRNEHLIKQVLDKYWFSKAHTIKGINHQGLFTFPFSIHRVENHPLVKWADVINLHWISKFVNYPSFFKSVNKPIVWTLHDMNPFSGGYHYLEDFPLDRFKKHTQKNTTVKIRSLAKADLNIVTLSKWLHNLSKESQILGSFPHTRIPNGIDISVFKDIEMRVARTIFGLPQDKKILLFVADSLNDSRKGYQILLNAIKKLNRTDLVLGVIGARSSDNAFSNEVNWLGRIHDERLMSLAYCAADLFVIPSKEDNLPNTVMESITSGTPVVGFKIGGVPDMIKNEFNGFLAEIIDANSLSNSIKTALDFKFDRQEIRNDAINRYSDSVQATKYIKLYKSIIS